MKNCLFLLLLSSSLIAALPTYFDYPPAEGESNFVMTEESLQKWTPHILAVIDDTNEYEDARAQFYFTYLYCAERDAAFLSHNTHGCFEGSLDPLIFRITTLFYPNITPPPEFESDPYSEALAENVGAKFARRFAENTKNHYLFWYPHTYDVPPPPENVAREIKKFNKQRRSMSDKEQETAKEWERSGMPGEKNWMTICNTYLDENHVPLGRRLEVRAVLMMSLSDAFSMTMLAKEKYQTPRPYVTDTTVEPLIKRPISASYPSAHAAYGGAGAEVMCCYFPEESREWVRLAKECAMSRVWGGVHYPMDIKEGLIIGKEAAKEVVSKQ